MNEKTAEVLRLLKAGGGWVSGQKMGLVSGITRSAVSKHIGLLREAGYGIESSSRRGYILQSVPDLPLKAEVDPLLTTKTAGRSYVFLDTASSTNDLASDYAAKGAPEGMVIVADSQSAGRGRLQREWYSPAGVNLYFSIILRPEVEPYRISQLPLLAAASIHRAIVKCCPGLDLKIKWPNDLMVQGRKLCGILCVSEAESDSVHHVVLGAGINVNSPVFPGDLRAVGASIIQETGKAASRSLLLAEVLNQFEADYAQWLQSADLSAIMPYLEKYSMMKGREISVRNLTGEIRGIAAGLSPDGGLQVETQKGLVTVMSGDATVLKL